MARQYLAIPATSAPSEHVFSCGRKILTYQRASLTAMHVEQIACVKDWARAFGPLYSHLRLQPVTFIPHESASSTTAIVVIQQVRRRPVLFFGVPFVGSLLVGSWMLSRLTQTRYEYQATRVQSLNHAEKLRLDQDQANRKPFDLREEYFRLSQPTAPQLSQLSYQLDKSVGTEQPNSRSKQKKLQNWDDWDGNQVRVPRPPGFPEWGGVDPSQRSPDAECQILHFHFHLKICVHTSSLKLYMLSVFIPRGKKEHLPALKLTATIFVFLSTETIVDGKLVKMTDKFKLSDLRDPAKIIADANPSNLPQVATSIATNMWKKRVKS
ncbi:hypothetical protein O181_086081 [Austropuccinia psidii MF-1]|uniref:Cytochrome c oxidase assembly protein COX16, mitochondrial n=1 Tax=Austropuccinia psidii MF-1 TaxID=1389203 RepID=A0A9Q3FZH8_9BASI|nr:hypothetical protein [Austropuccinia psidii MF-1]